MLTLDGVSYRYAGAAEASLHDVSLDLGAGEVVGLIGASEAGKTTLCYVVSGLAPRSLRGTLTGTVTLDGEDVSAWPMHQMAAAVGMGFQDPATQRSGIARTVYEEVAFGPANLALPRVEVMERTEHALDRLGIAALAARDPVRLSGGQAQLVALAGILAMRPTHLVLDEPTAQLDPDGTRLVARALADLRGAGTGLLLVEQKTDVLAALADRVAVMAGGRIVLAGPAVDVLNDERLPDWGVEPPSDARLLRALGAAGLASDEVRAAVIAAVAAR